MSIDGYIADKDGKTDWMVWSWGPEWTWDEALRKYFTKLKSSVDCVLLSRKMAEEGFIGHWANVAAKPGDPQANFASKINDAQKVIFSTTLDTAPWSNSRLANGDLADEVNALKKQPGKDMIVYGGAAFVSSLIQADLIDEYYLFINPALLGDGLDIFEGLVGKLNLSLVNSHAYDCGVVVLEYARKTRS